MKPNGKFGPSVAAHFLLILLLASSSAYGESKSDIRITLGAYDINLGASISEISQIYPVRVTEDPIIKLYKKFGFGDPDKRARINKIINQEYYEISHNCPENVDNIRLTTINGFIYRIGIYFRPEYSKEISWELFTYHAIEKLWATSHQ
jgi:hypothetical protein